MARTKNYNKFQLQTSTDSRMASLEIFKWKAMELELC